MLYMGSIRLTSTVAVFGPMILTKFFRFNPDSFVLVVVKQFGTGVIVSTAFVHVSLALSC